MELKNNVIKEYLKNVYFVSGTACGGKTTVTRKLGEMFPAMIVYDVDDAFERHATAADPAIQPNMCRQFRDADEFFSRTVDEYKAWLIGNLEEQLDFIILDLIALSQKGQVICDCNINLEQARILSDPSRVVFLLKEPGDIVEEYYNREDHKPFRDWIHSASDYEAAKKVCGDTLRSLNAEFRKEVMNSEFFWLDRADGRSREETVLEVQRHFGIGTGLSMYQVEKDTKLAEELLSFVENCSWTEVKDHIAELIRNWEFTDWETVFVARKDGRIIGMAAVMKTDYYPLPEIYPWINCVFVDEAYRGNYISKKLIIAANQYLKEQGFDRSYIASSFEALYEKYGYTYVKDIINYGGDTDRLYVKDI